MSVKYKLYKFDGDMYIIPLDKYDYFDSLAESYFADYCVGLGDISEYENCIEQAINDCGGKVFDPKYDSHLLVDKNTQRRVLVWSEATKHILNSHTHRVCFVSNVGDNHARNNDVREIVIINRYDDNDGVFIDTESNSYKYAVAIDGQANCIEIELNP